MSYFLTRLFSLRPRLWGAKAPLLFAPFQQPRPVPLRRGWGHAVRCFLASSLSGVALLLWATCAFAQWPPGPTMLSGGNNNSAPPANSIGTEGNYYFDYNTGNIFGPKSFGQWSATPTARFPAPSVPHVAMNVALAAATTAQYPLGVWRDNFALGYQASPLFFAPETGTCAANGMVNDGGSCVNEASGNSFKAVFSNGGAGAAGTVQAGLPYELNGRKLGVVTQGALTLAQNVANPGALFNRSGSSIATAAGNAYFYLNVFGSWTQNQ